MATVQVYTASKIFTGIEWLNEHAILCRDDTIEAVIPIKDISSDIRIQDCGNTILAPAFIDIQIYGAGGRLFSVYPDQESLYKLNDYCNAGGASLCLATAATNSDEVFYKCIDAIKEYWKSNGKGIYGLHIEGPWINPVKRGAHLEKYIQKPILNQVKELLEYGKGVIKMITLAPEMCDDSIIDLICTYGIVISAGHSNATDAQAKNGFKQGVTAVTHLYNAMSPLQHRAPGLVGAVMDDEQAMASIIPDGHHCDYAAVRIAKKVMNERLFVITDAVTETNQGPYQHTLVGDKYEAAGVLSGSALTMFQAFLNLINHCSIEIDEALRMCSLYPAQVLGIQHKMGQIEKGFDANIISIDINQKAVSLLK